MHRRGGRRLWKGRARGSGEATFYQQWLRATAEAQLAGDRKAAYKKMSLGGEHVQLPRSYGAQLEAAEEQARAQLKERYLASGRSMAQWRRLERSMSQG